MSLAPVYVFCSDDPFLKSDRSSAILKQARNELPEAGFLIFTNDDFSSGSKANLSRLENELIDPGLFGGDRIIKIYLNALNAIALQVLQLLAKRSRPGVVCIVELPRIVKSLVPAKAEPYKEDLKATGDAKAKHIFAFLKDIGSVIEILYAPTGRDFTQWIVQRAKHYGFNIQNDAADFLTLSCEGNLVAVDQFYQLIKLSSDTNDISLELASSFLSSNSRYSGFEFAEAVLAPDTMRALNILYSVCKTNTNISTVVSMIISNFDRVLAAVSATHKNPKMMSGSVDFREKANFFRSLYISVPSAQDAVLKAARKMPQDFFDYLESELARASKAIQYFDESTAYQCLQNMAVSVANTSVRELKEL